MKTLKLLGSWLLCATGVALVCSAAVMTQVATPEILPLYHHNAAAEVPMYDDTSGATIFYTKVSGYGPCTTPQHMGSTPIAPTKLFVFNNRPMVPLNAVQSFKAVAYKAGSTDSLFTNCVVVDNTNQ